MTTQEFSIEFDILYNNLASNTAPPINEYEKSVFLTKAQSDIVLELYSGRNQLGLSFESNEEVRHYLAPLGTSADCEISVKGENIGSTVKVLVSSIDLSSFLVITREILLEKGSSSNSYKRVIPVPQDDIISLINNPFRGPSNTRALRVSENNETHLLVKGDDIKTYTYKVYGLKKPSPIILEICGIAEGDLSIDGVDCIQPSNGDLPDSLHNMILERAVLLAKQAYIGGQTQS